jgi:hypothetical protein
LDHPGVSNAIAASSLLEEQPNAILAELTAVVDQESLVHRPLCQCLVSFPLSLKRLGEQRVVRRFGEHGRIFLNERVGLLKIADGDLRKGSRGRGERAEVGVVLGSNGGRLGSAGLLK